MNAQSSENASRPDKSMPFRQWWYANVPPGTVISDPEWWAKRIAPFFHMTLSTDVAAPKEAGDYLLREIDRALNGDVLAVLMDVQNGIDSPGLAGMANSAIRRLEYVKELAARLAAPSKEAGPSDATFARIERNIVPVHVGEKGARIVALCKQMGYDNETTALMVFTEMVLAADPPTANPSGDQRQEGVTIVARVARELREYDPRGDEYKGQHVHKGWAKDLDAALASPPPEAAASVGDDAPQPVAFLRDMLSELRLERHTLRNQWRSEALEVAIAALASPTGVDEVRIPKSDRLDPITLYIAGEGGGRGRMTIVCYNEAWTCYWGAMGNRTLREFVADCDAGYVAGNMLSGRVNTAHERDYAERIAAAVIAALAARDGGAA